MRLLNRTPRLRPALATLALCAATAAPAHAHFIWIHLLEEGSPPTAEILFGDGIYQDGDANLVRLMDGINAWTASGEALDCHAQGWGLSADLPGGTELIGASRPMGVFKSPRDGQICLLEYYAKGAANVAAASKPMAMHAEVLCRPDDGDLVFQVLFDGRPSAGAELLVPVPHSTEEEALTADENGEVRVPDPGVGSFAVRGRVIVPKEGQAEDGQAYTSVQHYATLVIASLRDEALPVGTSLNAYERLESAYLCRETLPESIAGVSGELKVNTNGKVLRGEFEFRGGQASLRLVDADEEVTQWASAKVASLLRHRMASSFAEGEGSYPLSIPPRDSHPLGRRIDLDEMGRSYYRVYGDEIMMVVRSLGGVRVELSVQENEETEAGRFLPKHFTVAYFDGDSGALQKAEAYTDQYKAVDGVQLPRSRRIVTLADGKTSVTTLEFSGLELLGATGQ